MLEKQRLLQEIKAKLENMTEEQKRSVLVYLENLKNETGAA